MKKTATLMLFAAFTTLATGCFHASPAPASPTLDIPVLAVSEPQDEWLHTYCAPKKVFTVGSVDEGAHAVHDTGGNLGEVVYVEGSALDVVSFACPSRPSWVPSVPSVPPVR